MPNVGSPSHARALPSHMLRTGGYVTPFLRSTKSDWASEASWARSKGGATPTAEALAARAVPGRLWQIGQRMNATRAKFPSEARQTVFILWEAQIFIHEPRPDIHHRCDELPQLKGNTTVHSKHHNVSRPGGVTDADSQTRAHLLEAAVNGLSER